eukprot:3938706-Rhodomonas_salina.1
MSGPDPHDRPCPVLTWHMLAVNLPSPDMLTSGCVVTRAHDSAPPPTKAHIRYICASHLCVWGVVVAVVCVGGDREGEGSGSRG